MVALGGELCDFGRKEKDFLYIVYCFMCFEFCTMCIY